jgi:hypothetical protein
MVKLKSERGVKKAKRLIAAVMAKIDTQKKAKYTEIDYSVVFNEIVENNESDEAEGESLSQIA